MESSLTQSFIGSYVLDQRIRKTLSTAKITLCEFDLTNRTISWSVDKSFHFYDFSKSYDGSFDGYYQLIHEEDKRIVNQLIKNLSFGEGVTATYRVKWTDDTYHWLETIGKVYVDQGVTKLVGTIQDITERKTLELERDNWEERHKLVAAAAGIIVYDYDIASGKILWSGDVEEVTSFSPKEMGDIDQWGKLIHPDDREEAFRLLEVAQEKLSTYEVYYRFRKKDRGYCHMYDRGTFIAKDGKAVRMLGMMSDVSEIVFSKTALVESEKRFESLMNNLNVGVALYDATMIPRMYNKAAYLLLGLNEDQFVGREVMNPDWNVLDVEGEPMKNRDFPIIQAMETRLAIRQVVMGVYRPSTNDRVWLMVDAEPMYNEEHELQHVICTYTDFSARRRMEETLKEKNQQLLFSSEEVNKRNERLLEFAQIVSHNLRSPLSSIAGLSKIYFSSDDDEKDTSVEYIRDVCSKALETIDDLNEILKVQQNDRLETKELVFEEVFDSVKELMKIKLLGRNVRLEVDFSQAPKLSYPDIYLESIFLNLLSNAIKYTPSSQTPDIKVVSKVNGKDIVLMFTDSGVGIDLKKHGNEIFNFGKTFHHHKKSKGVGLFLVKNQVRAMGDHIDVESEVGIGTTFIITFKNQRNEK